jgi:hypothetical protein
MTDFIVVDNGDDGNTRPLLFADQTLAQGRVTASRDPPPTDQLILHRYETVAAA